MPGPLSEPLLPLLGAVVWTLLMVIAIAGHRTVEVLSGRARANGFASGQPHGPDWYQRLNRAHMNCVENVPLFAAVVLVGVTIHVQDHPFAWLAWGWLAARVLQTLAHLSSGRSLAVRVRFGFFLVQHLCLFWMVGLLLESLLR